MIKPLHWVASSLKDVRSFPEDVKDEVGFALHLAQNGDMAFHATPMVGFGGAKVIEIVVDNTATHTERFTRLNLRRRSMFFTFSKKSKRGIQTPRPDLAVIKERLRTAEIHYKQTYSDLEPRRQHDEL